jgi:type II secretory pathway pseudopilin PulG
MKLSSITNQGGDTIVEVILVLAILGLAISISYATANTSLLDARQAQENSQAAEVVATQVEDLRVMAANPKLKPDETPNLNYIFSYTGAAQLFCVDATNKAIATTSLGARNAACNYNGLYDVFITGPGAGGGDFTITAIWDDVEGLGTDTITMTYRVYPQT